MENDRQKVLEWLSDMSFSAMHDEFLNTWQAGTGSWLRETDEFVRWARGDTKTLWCRGGRGAGKTVLMATVFEYFRDLQLENTAILQLYLTNRDQEQQTSTELIASLVRQLAEHSERLSSAVSTCYERHLSSQTRPLDREYKALLLSEAQQFDKIYIIIDGLDECRNQTRLDLFREANQLTRTYDKTQLLVSSRPIDAIAIDLTDHVELTIEAHSSDIHIFLKACIDSFDTLRRLTGRFPELREIIQHTLVEKARGMFLLAKLHIRLLESSKKRTKNDFLNLLENLPTVLDDTYKQIWIQILAQDEEDVALVRSVMRWVCYAMEPLSAQALQHALLATKMDHLTSINEGDLEDVDELIQLCNGLIVLHKQTGVVRFEHYTAEEFFPGYLANTLPETQSIISIACIRYMYLVLQWFGWEHLSTHRSSLHPFTIYAFKHWGSHARLYEIDHNPLDSVLGLLGQSNNVLCEVARTFISFTSDSADFPLATNVHALHIASLFGLSRSAAYLMGKDQSLLYCMDELKRSSLRWACLGRQRRMFEYLIEQGSDVDEVDSFGNTALIWALARRDTIRTVQFKTFSGSGLFRGLVDTVHLNVGDAQSSPPSEIPPPFRTSTEIIDLLIRHSRNINFRDPTGRTALSRAAENQQFDVVDKLLHMSSDIDSEDIQGATPLVWALQAPRRYNDVNDVNISGNVIAHFGYRVTVTVSVRSSPKSSRDIDREQMDQLNPQLRFARRLMGKKVDSVDFNGRTALSLAAEAGNVELVQSLIDAKADVNKADREEMTPLMWASKPFYPLKSRFSNNNVGGNARVLMGTIIDVRGSTSNIDIQDDSRFVAKRIKIINLLADAGADFSRTNRGNKNALYFADSSAWMATLQKRMRKADPDHLPLEVKQADFKEKFNNSGVVQRVRAGEGLDNDRGARCLYPAGATAFTNNHSSGNSHTFFGFDMAAMNSGIAHLQEACQDIVCDSNCFTGDSEAVVASTFLSGTHMNHLDFLTGHWSLDLINGTSTGEVVQVDLEQNDILL